MQRSLVGSEMCIRDRRMQVGQLTENLGLVRWPCGSQVRFKREVIQRVSNHDSRLQSQSLGMGASQGFRETPNFLPMPLSEMQFDQGQLQFSRQRGRWMQFLFSLEGFHRVRQGAASRQQLCQLERNGCADVSGTCTTSCLLYTSPSPRDYAASRMPSSA